MGPPAGHATPHADRIHLRFDSGTIRLETTVERASDLRALDLLESAGVTLVSDSREDPGTLRADANQYVPLRVSLERAEAPFVDTVLSLEEIDPPLTSTYELRPYQQQALEGWLETDRWDDSGGDLDPGHQPAPGGVLELPTGSGKTVIALKALERLSVPTLVVVPTLDLLEQWVGELEAEFDVPIGRFGGGEQRLEALTVSTYDSAYLKAEAVGDRFGFVIFDEVHHLGGEGYRSIARSLPAPARLGLTATFERPDGAHDVIERLVGPVVARLSPDDLAGEHLARYDVKRLEVSLTPEERRAYEEAQGTFTEYLARSNIQMRSGADYQELVKRSGTDPAAREALLARQRARDIMLGAQGKLEALEAILERHPDDRTIIFPAYNDLAYAVGERFLLPVLTHQTGASERRDLLERFRHGTYPRIVTSNVLDEGVDVPDASVAVVLSGSASEREFTQRLGRILRPKDDGGRALLYEVVTAETSEESIADRRR